MTHDEMIAVIEHHKKGGLLESRPRHSTGGWSRNIRAPIWDFSHFDYRPKKEPVVVWGIAWEDGHMSPNFFKSRESAEDFAGGYGSGRVVKLEEVGE